MRKINAKFFFLIIAPQTPSQSGFSILINKNIIKV
nr:MAG TPA: hypothetical protein [Caudoviricetes sp.]